MVERGEGSSKVRGDDSQEEHVTMRVFGEHYVEALKKGCTGVDASVMVQVLRGSKPG